MGRENKKFREGNRAGRKIFWDMHGELQKNEGDVGGEINNFKKGYIGWGEKNF